THRLPWASSAHNTKATHKSVRSFELASRSTPSLSWRQRVVKGNERGRNTGWNNRVVLGVCQSVSIVDRESLLKINPVQVDNGKDALGKQVAHGIEVKLCNRRGE